MSENLTIEFAVDPTMPCDIQMMDLWMKVYKHYDNKELVNQDQSELGERR